MKSGAFIGLLLLLLGGAVVGIWTWRKWDTASSPSYQPATFTAEEKEFIQTAYRFLDLQRRSDERRQGAHISTLFESLLAQPLLTMEIRPDV